jgi:hypothetical protein
MTALSAAVREAGCGPQRLLAAMQRDARNGGQSRRSADGAGTAASDPKATFVPRHPTRCAAMKEIASPVWSEVSAGALEAFGTRADRGTEIE